MATTRWKSSLANIEARMRRSLGIAGPIDLTLEEPPKLTPVVLTDDQTRPGCASDFRGRRFQLTFDVTGITVVNGFGGFGITTDAPLGVVLDELDCVATAATGTDIIYMGVFLLSATQISSWPYPLTAFRAGWLTDPNLSASDVAPVFAGQNNALAVTGQRISQFAMICNGTTHWQQRLDVWLPLNASMMVGNFQGVASTTRIIANIRGRIF